MHKLAFLIPTLSAINFWLFMTSDTIVPIDTCARRFKVFARLFPAELPQDRKMSVIQFVRMRELASGQIASIRTDIMQMTGARI
jgi:hypothetical protein